MYCIINDEHVLQSNPEAATPPAYAVTSASVPYSSCLGICDTISPLEEKTSIKRRISRPRSTTPVMHPTRDGERGGLSGYRPHCCILLSAACAAAGNFPEHKRRQFHRQPSPLLDPLSTLLINHHDVPLAGLRYWARRCLRDFAGCAPPGLGLAGHQHRVR
nr:hypothetical protein CFP56_65208 [Quercus suber]